MSNIYDLFSSKSAKAKESEKKGSLLYVDPEGRMYDIEFTNADFEIEPIPLGDGKIKLVMRKKGSKPPLPKIDAVQTRTQHLREFLWTCLAGGVAVFASYLIMCAIAKLLGVPK